MLAQSWFLLVHHEHVCAQNSLDHSRSALYHLEGYSTEARKGLGHLRFTAYSYPDEWEILGLTDQKPAFFADYKADFDPNHLHRNDHMGTIVLMALRWNSMML